MIYNMVGGSGGSSPEAYAAISVTYPAGSVCTASKTGEATLAAPDTSGSWLCLVPSGGEWTVSCTDGTSTSTKTVNVNDKGVYTIKLSYRVPEGYTGLQYITFTNGAWINTELGIPEDGDLEFLINNPTYSNDEHFYGTSGDYQWPHFTTYSNKYYVSVRQGDWNFGTWAAGMKHVRINPNRQHHVVLNNEVAYSYNAVPYSANPIYIGKRQNAANFVSSVCKFLIYDANGNPLMDLQPVRRNSDNAVMFWDVVRERFLTNSGSGNLIAGEVL